MTSRKISIGLPVYNGQKHVAKAIESLLAQSFSDFELIISDNGSTDGTSDIIASKASNDSRIRYYRQQSNNGATANFGFVLEKASAPYFMWAAADDYWHEDYISECLNFLDENEDYVACVSKAIFEGADRSSTEIMGTYGLASGVKENLKDFISNPGANSRFYAVHRTNAIRDAWCGESFWASDWYMVCKELTLGKYHELPRILMVRGPHGESSDGYAKLIDRKIGLLHTAFPYLTYSLKVMKMKCIRFDPRVTAHLLWLNLDTAIVMAGKWLMSKQKTNQ